MAIRSHEYKTSKKQFNKLYSKYKSARLTLISRLEKNGESKEEIAKRIPLTSKREFKETYLRVKEIRKDTGNYRSTLKLTFEAIHNVFSYEQYSRYRSQMKSIRESYLASHPKAKGLSRQELNLELEKAGYSKISSAEFMYGEGGSNFLRDQYHVFREKGFSSQDAKREITRQYFGSK